ncbi:MAG: hypothetical protein ACK4VI_01935 [Alphaproteobacteria bacterium]
MPKPQQAKKFLLQFKIYRIAAISMAVAGLVIFIHLYTTNIGSDIGNFFKKPMLFIILAIPFVPSVIFLFLAKNSRKKAIAVLIQSGDLKS